MPMPSLDPTPSGLAERIPRSVPDEAHDASYLAASAKTRNFSTRLHPESARFPVCSETSSWLMQAATPNAPRLRGHGACYACGRGARESLCNDAAGSPRQMIRRLLGALLLLLAALGQGSAQDAPAPAPALPSPGPCPATAPAPSPPVPETHVPGRARASGRRTAPNPAPPAQPAPEMPKPVASTQSVLGTLVHGEDGSSVGRLVDVLVDKSGVPREAVLDAGRLPRRREPAHRRALANACISTRTAKTRLSPSR